MDLRKSPLMHNYKYLDVPIFNYLKCCISERKTDACMQFATVLLSMAIYSPSVHIVFLVAMPIPQALQ